jgi:hypothetical protein
MPTRPLLTKSRFLAGRQCSKRLWRQVRAPLEDRSGSSRVAHNGTEIGSLAHRLRPNAPQQRVTRRSPMRYRSGSAEPCAATG